MMYPFQFQVGDIIKIAGPEVHMLVVAAWKTRYEEYYRVLYLTGGKGSRATEHSYSRNNVETNCVKVA